MQNPTLKVIGATATEIRYLDNSRDMVEEIFNGISVRGIDLATAINDGVLPTFKYVTAYHGSEQDFDEYREKVNSIADKKQRKDLSRRLEMCVQNKTSIKMALYENLSMANHKIIVFLNGLCEIDKAIEMFTEIFPKCDCNSVSSKKNDKENKENITRFQQSEKQISILFAVDMLNEGVHIKGVDNVVMFRNTESPQIYFQQMGRVLDANNGSDRVIFDFVCNAKSIKTNVNGCRETNIIHEINKKTQDKKRKIIIKSYTEDLENLFQEIHQFISNRKWTEQESDFLLANYKKIPTEEIAKRLDRTTRAIKQRARLLGISNNGWSKEEENFVKEKYGEIPIEKIAEQIGRSERAVKHRILKLGLVATKEWSEKDSDYLKENYNKMPATKLAKKMGWSERTIRRKAQELGLNGPIRKWSEDEDRFLAQHSNELTAREIAKALGRTKGAVQYRKIALGITK